MEELHAAIAAHLRAQRRQLAETGERESGIRNSWRDHCVVPRFKACGAAIDDNDGGLYNLTDMRQVCGCRDHYVPF